MKDEKEWVKLIEEHYLSACKRNPDYEKKYSREEMKTWWMSVKNSKSGFNPEGYIKGCTDTNNNNTTFHPA